MFKKVKFWILVSSVGFAFLFLDYGFFALAQIKAVEIENKICPVSGKEIKKDEAVKVEHEGKIYNLCCKMCVKDFKKNPQKYIQELEKMEKKEGSKHEEHGDHH